MTEELDETKIPEVVEPESASLPVISQLPTKDIVRVAQEAEQRFDSIATIRNFALKVTNTDDWSDEGGKPYLFGSGAEKIAAAYGVTWKFIGEPKKEVRQHSEGDFYIYTIKGKFSAFGQSIEVYGTRSSRDKLFGLRYNETAKKKMYIPSEDVDEPNIIKSAQTNCIANGIKRLLGLRNITWAELGKIGIKPSTKVNYNKGANTTESADPGDVDKQHELRGYIISMYPGTDPESQKTRKEYLESMTKFTAKDGKEVRGIRDLEKLVGIRLNIALHNVKTEYNKIMGESDSENTQS